MGRCAAYDERCWSEHTGVGRRALPPACPTKGWAEDRTWLDNYNIDDVLSRYERRYRSFRFVGVFPIDFASPLGEGCVVASMCKFDASRVPRKRLGFVFNLDRHDQSGSHWVALFVCTTRVDKNYGAFYFDSVGLPPPNEIVVLMKKIGAQLKDPDFPIEYNRVRRQFKNTECGMFCIHFLTECLRGGRVAEVAGSALYDDDMQKLRLSYFGC
jgi:hypothetical protein